MPYHIAIFVICAVAIGFSALGFNAGAKVATTNMRYVIAEHDQKQTEAFQRECGWLP